MKFKDWFLAWPDYVINNSEFTCIGGPQKWHFYIDETQAGINTVDLLRKEIENGWGPANYDVVRVEGLHPRLGSIVRTDDGSMGTNITCHFIIECKEHVDDIPAEDITKLINAMAE